MGFLASHRARIADASLRYENGSDEVRVSPDPLESFRGRYHVWETQTKFGIDATLVCIYLGPPETVPIDGPATSMLGDDWCEVGHSAMARVSLHYNLAGQLLDSFPTINQMDRILLTELWTHPTYFVYTPRAVRALWDTNAWILKAGYPRMVPVAHPTSAEYAGRTAAVCYVLSTDFERDLLQMPPGQRVALIHGHLLVGDRKSLVELFRLVNVGIRHSPWRNAIRPTPQI